MKKSKAIPAFFTMIVMLLMSSVISAQTITVDSVSGTTFCSGDPVSVTFTTAGFWDHNNAFTLQLSNASGGFQDGFNNLGSLKDTLPGTFTIIASIPSSTSYSNQYSLRVIGAIPYTASSNVVSAITIGQSPVSGQFLTSFGANMGTPPVILLEFPPDWTSSTSDTVSWNFGSDGTPPTESGVGLTTPDVKYMTGGSKTITATMSAPGDCSLPITDTMVLWVYDCSSLSIPHDAHVIDTNTVWAGDGATLWVDPGVSLALTGSEDTVFAEPGSTVGCSGDLDHIYVKEGVVYRNTQGEYDILVYSNGASISDPQDYQDMMDLEVPCDSVVFDYSVAPPNSIMHINESASVASPASVGSIEISPNPTNGIILLQGIPVNANITAMNVLGQTVQELKASGNSNVTLDLSTVAPGTYYIRMASGNNVTTKMIVKE
jgi:hypothetical protein